MDTETNVIEDILIPSEFARLLDDDWREAAVFGGRYSLKSHTVARILLIKAMESKKRIACLREFQNSIADSSYQLLVDLITLYKLDMFHVTRDAIINTSNNSDFIFKGLHNNTQNIKSIEGIDYAWVEEAQTITENSIEILVPTVRKKNSKLIWTYNRLTELDPIHKRLIIDGKPDTLVINANYDIAEKYGWLEEATKKEIEWDKENNPSLYAHKWLGEPMTQTEMAIIGRDQVINSISREVSDEGMIEVGVDVARMGDDRSVFWKRKGLKTIGKQIYSKLSLTDLADRLEAFLTFNKTILCKVDDTGVGGGLTDIMKERGYNIMPINFGSSAQDSDKYPNYISEAWFYLQSVIDTIQLPADNDLIMELSSRKWKQDTKGRRGVESKADYKKRGFRSPDLADACIIAYYTPKPFILEWGDI